MVILEVDEMNLGSEISDLLIDFLRLAGMRPWLWKPCDVGVFAPDPIGDGCAKEGVGLTEKGVIGEGLGDNPISIPLPV